MYNKIKIDIDELMDILHQIENDGFATVELEIMDEGFFEGAGELRVSAVEISEDVSNPYRTITGINYYDGDSIEELEYT